MSPVQLLWLLVCVKMPILVYGLSYALIFRLWLHPRRHREQRRAAVRPWRPAAEVLAGQGGARFEHQERGRTRGGRGDGGRRVGRVGLDSVRADDYPKQLVLYW